MSVGKFVTPVLFCTILFSYKAYPQDQDTIYWHSNYKLKWEDFEGSPDLSVKDVAISYPAIRYHLSVNNDSFSATVLCFFVKSISWTKDKNNTVLLEHEQGHFDIAEIFARKLRKGIAENQFNASTVGENIKALFNVNKQERNLAELQYDKDTNHSQNIEQQINWNKKIKVELDRLKKYASH